MLVLCRCCTGLSPAHLDASPRPATKDPNSGLKFEDVPNGLAAISKVPTAGWLQIFAYCGFVEFSAGFGKDIAEGKPGQLGFTVLTSADPAEKTKKLSAEIANGRLAMMAIIGMFFQAPLWRCVVFLSAQRL